MSTLLVVIQGLPNASEPVPGWVTGGQPTADQVAALHRAGCQVILDNRDPMEPRPFDEPATVRAAGMEYINIPMGHGAVTIDTMKQMHEAVKKLVGRKAMLHCASGNRTAAALIPYLMLDQGMQEQDAVDTAMRIGLRSSELMEIALQYVNGTRKS